MISYLYDFQAGPAASSMQWTSRDPPKEKLAASCNTIMYRVNCKMYYKIFTLTLLIAIHAIVSVFGGSLGSSMRVWYIHINIMLRIVNDLLELSESVSCCIAISKPAFPITIKEWITLLLHLKSRLSQSPVVSMFLTLVTWYLHSAVYAVQEVGDTIWVKTAGASINCMSNVTRSNLIRSLEISRK